jgi:ceramide glucosyltransferase
MPPISTFIAAVCAVLAVAGTAYFVLTIWAAKRYPATLRRPSNSRFIPPVSILKSLKGVDPHMYAAFRSHCVLDYPEYEVLFGVQDLGEPALTLVEKLKEEFPQRQVRVVQCPQVLGMNGKVSTLAQMLPQAQHEHIIINDSDILVPRDYLSRVLAPFAAADVGMVTTLYRALPGKTLGSRLEALGLATEFAGAVLLAREMEGGIRFGLGATLATTKTAIQEIGGLEAIVDYIADDYELGARIAAKGHRIELAQTIVETALPDYTFGEFWSHQLRWARTVKACRPAQYLGLLFTLGLPWAVLAVIASPLSWWTWLVFGVAAVTRFASAWFVPTRVLQDDHVVRDLWLVPVRDFVALAIWVASYMGNTVEWRGIHFKLRDGKLERA